MQASWGLALWMCRRSRPIAIRSGICIVIQASQRDILRERLAQDGVETTIHYPTPPHRQGAYAAMNLPAGRFPVSERLASRVLSLPIGPTVSDAQLRHVAKCMAMAAPRAQRRVV